jgi:hypothetical protein
MLHNELLPLPIARHRSGRQHCAAGLYELSTLFIADRLIHRFSGVKERVYRVLKQLQEALEVPTRGDGPAQG